MSGYNYHDVLSNIDVGNDFIGIQLEKIAKALEKIAEREPKERIQYVAYPVYTQPAAAGQWYPARPYQYPTYPVVTNQTAGDPAVLSIN